MRTKALAGGAVIAAGIVGAGGYAASAAAADDDTGVEATAGHGKTTAGQSKTSVKQILARDGYTYSPSETAGAKSGTLNWLAQPGHGQRHMVPGTPGVASAMGDNASGYETVIQYKPGDTSTLAVPSWDHKHEVNVDGTKFVIVDVPANLGVAP